LVESRQLVAVPVKDAHDPDAASWVLAVVDYVTTGWETSDASLNLVARRSGQWVAAKHLETPGNGLNHSFCNIRIGFSREVKPNSIQVRSRWRCQAHPLHGR
jgi:hypothetical protein